MAGFPRPRASRQAVLRFAAALVAAVLLSGCETLAYYAQAVSGQLELVSHARPLEIVASDPATAPELRERLWLAGSIRDFAARELRLPDNGSYRSYADIGRRYVVWNVFAAPEFSLEPVTSCFPVAGCVAYRGFFARDDAVSHAARLLAQGNDVHLFGVPAYSTLGRFDDPLLSSFIFYSDAELARLLLHELAHQLLYLKDDSTFNESFAAVVEREGVRRWLEASGRGAQMPAFLEAERRKAELLAQVGQTRARLEAVYRSRIAPGEMRARKRAEMDALRAKMINPAPVAEGRRIEPNNALLAAYATYTQLAPAFEKLLAEEGGDLGRFYDRAKKMASERSSRGPSSAPSR